MGTGLVGAPVRLYKLNPAADPPLERAWFQPLILSSEENRFQAFAFFKRTSYRYAPACGDVMKLQIRVDDDGNIVDSCFKTFGCGQGWLRITQGCCCVTPTPSACQIGYVVDHTGCHRQSVDWCRHSSVASLRVVTPPLPGVRFVARVCQICCWLHGEGHGPYWLSSVDWCLVLGDQCIHIT